MLVCLRLHLTPLILVVMNFLIIFMMKCFLISCNDTYAKMNDSTAERTVITITVKSL